MQDIKKVVEKLKQSIIKQNVLRAARPYLEGRTVKDLVIGISMIGCQLSDNSVGVSYVLRHSLPAGCSSFAYPVEALGQSAWEVAKWSVNGEEDLKRSIGNAVLSAASQQLDIADDTDERCFFGMDITEDDIVGMIGFIRPVAATLQSKVKQLIIFDERLSEAGDNAIVCPMEQQPELLPTCTRMIITGSSTINGTIDELLEMCSNAKQIALVGSSTPMFPEGWKDTNVTTLAGSWWKNEEKDDIFKIISLGGGIPQLKAYMQKKIAYVK